MNRTRTAIAMSLVATAAILAAAPRVFAAPKSKAQLRAETDRCEDQWNRARSRCNQPKMTAAQKQQCNDTVWNDFATCMEGVEKGLSRTLKRPGISARANPPTATPAPAPTPKTRWVVPGARQTGSHMR